MTGSYSIKGKSNEILLYFIGFEKTLAESFRPVCLALDKKAHVFWYKGDYNHSRLPEIESTLFHHVLSHCADKNKLMVPRALLLCYPYALHNEIAPFFYPYARFLPLHSPTEGWENRAEQCHTLLQTHLPPILTQLKTETLSELDTRRLPLRNFDIKGQKTLHTHFLQCITMQKKNSANLPAKFGHIRPIPCPHGRREGDRSFKDQKGWHFSKDPTPHGGQSIRKPAGNNPFNPADIRCFLQGVYRFGLYLEPGAHFDVLFGTQDVAFCCQLNKKSKHNCISHINLYPNDTWRS